MLAARIGEIERAGATVHRVPELPFTKLFRGVIDDATPLLALGYAVVEMPILASATGLIPAPAAKEVCAALTYEA